VEISGECVFEVKKDILFVLYFRFICLSGLGCGRGDTIIQYWVGEKRITSDGRMTQCQRFVALELCKNRIPSAVHLLVYRTCSCLGSDEIILLKNL
jgi:hypothetical protein